MLVIWLKYFSKKMKQGFDEIGGIRLIIVESG